MGFLLRIASLAPILFALPAHAQSTHESASAMAEAPNAARPAVTATPSVNSAPRQDSTTLEPAGAPRAAPMPLPPTVPTESGPREYTSWYGGQTLTTDALALGFLFSAALVADHDEQHLTEKLVGTSFAVYAAGGPIVHAAHGNWGRAFGSLGLRISAPIVGASLGAAMENCSGSEFCGVGGWLVGATVGVGTAIAIDAAVIARETVSEEPAVMPVVTTGKNGTWLGVSGRF